MKTTLDIPDGLYRRLKAKAALRGKSVREVAIRLFEDWVNAPAEAPQSSGAAAERETGALAWLDSWFAVADESMRLAPAGPSAREILEEDRNRLEPGP